MPHTKLLTSRALEAVRPQHMSARAFKVIAVAIFVVGGLLMSSSSPSQASSTETRSASTASEIQDAASPAAARCGLSYSGPIFGQYTYTIRNCHGYAVKRKLDLRIPIVGYPDGPCHRIRAHSSIRRTISIPDSARIHGMKAC
jgi:hypothetical protein